MTDYKNRKLPEVSEVEYMDHLDKYLNRLSARIARSGLAITDIARGTRMKWSTVYNAACGVPVRMDSASRISLFLERFEGMQQTQTN